MYLQKNIKFEIENAYNYPKFLTDFMEIALLKFSNFIVLSAFVY